MTEPKPARHRDKQRAAPEAPCETGEDVALTIPADGEAALTPRIDDLEFIDDEEERPTGPSRGYHTLEPPAPPQQRKAKARPGKKKLRKDKWMHSSSGDLESSSSGSSGDGRAKRELLVVKRTVTTDVEAVTTTTTSLKRCTLMRVETNSDGDEEKKLRTQSCSSIPVQDFINNLAVFRKSFDNVNIFEDETLRKVRWNAAVTVTWKEKCGCFPR